jgi:hypothetical protein
MSKKETQRKHIYACRLILNGATLGEAGKHIGVTRERTRQILISLLRKAASLSLKNDSKPPRNHREPIRDIRENKEYWLDRIDAIEKHWDV